MRLTNITSKKLESLLLFTFMFYGINATAQQNNTGTFSKVFELQSFISSAKKNAIVSKPSRINNTDNLEDLIFHNQPSIYYYKGEVKTYGEKPKNLFTEVALVNKLNDTEMLKNNIEIITININTTSDTNQIIDTHSFSSFKNLKYIYLVFDFEISEAKITNMIRNENDKYSVFYKVSLGDSN